MTEIEAKHFQIAAELEQSIHRSGRLVGQAWPWLSLAVELVPDGDRHDPLLSMMRSASHALRVDGLGLNSPLISAPAPGDREIVMEWCRRTGRQPNDHWNSMGAAVLTDQYLWLRSALSLSEFVTDDGRLSDEQKGQALPSLSMAAAYDRPKILEIVSLDNGDF